jgi:hypothetical protein
LKNRGNGKEKRGTSSFYRIGVEKAVSTRIGKALQLDRSDLLSHEYVVGDTKADKGNCYKGNEVGKHNVNALRKG